MARGGPGIGNSVLCGCGEWQGMWGERREAGGVICVRWSGERGEGVRAEKGGAGGVNCVRWSGERGEKVRAEKGGAGGVNCVRWSGERGEGVRAEKRGAGGVICVGVGVKRGTVRVLWGAGEMTGGAVACGVGKAALCWAQAQRCVHGERSCGRGCLEGLVRAVGPGKGRRRRRSVGNCRHGAWRLAQGGLLLEERRGWESYACA